MQMNMTSAANSPAPLADEKRSYYVQTARDLVVQCSVH